MGNKENYAVYSVELIREPFESNFAGKSFITLFSTKSKPYLCSILMIVSIGSDRNIFMFYTYELLHNSPSHRKNISYNGNKYTFKIYKENK